MQVSRSQGSKICLFVIALLTVLSLFFSVLTGAKVSASASEESAESTVAASTALTDIQGGGGSFNN